MQTGFPQSGKYLRSGTQTPPSLRFFHNSLSISTGKTIFKTVSTTIKPPYPDINLILELLISYGDVVRIWSNIYDEAFFAKIDSTL